MPLLGAAGVTSHNVIAMVIVLASESGPHGYISRTIAAIGAVADGQSMRGRRVEDVLQGLSIASHKRDPDPRQPNSDWVEPRNIDHPQLQSKLERGNRTST